jgi:hypothetical protein
VAQSCRLSFVQVSSHASEHGRRVRLRRYPAGLVLGRDSPGGEVFGSRRFRRERPRGPNDLTLLIGVNRLRLDRPPLWLSVLVQRGELGGCQSSEPLSVFAKGRLELGEDYFQLRLLGRYGRGTQFPDSIFQSPEHGGLRQRYS